MRNDKQDRYQQENRLGGNSPDNSRESDITDPERDREKLKGDQASLDLPDVKDIPGQEFVHAPLPDSFADTTISSADEEGEGIFEEDEDEETSVVRTTVADITAEDKQVPETAEEYLPTRDEDNLHKAELDQSDNEGDVLNEKAGDFSGNDLDLPSENDSARSGDEENKYFSLGSDDNDANETRS